MQEEQIENTVKQTKTDRKSKNGEIIICGCKQEFKQKYHKIKKKLPVKEKDKKNKKKHVFEVIKTTKNGKTKEKIVYKYKTKTIKIPYTRAETICHCDSCGKKWGEHIYPDIDNMKEICAACGEKINNQNLVNYHTRGNFCSFCLRVINENTMFNQKTKSKDEEKSLFASLFKKKEEEIDNNQII